MVLAADARCVIPLRTAEKKQGIKRRPQADARCFLPLRRATGALAAELAGAFVAELPGGSTAAAAGSQPGFSAAR
jgi:hypothetical protein